MMPDSLKQMMVQKQQQMQQKQGLSPIWQTIPKDENKKNQDTHYQSFLNSKYSETNTCCSNSMFRTSKQLPQKKPIQKISKTTCPQKHYSNKIYSTYELCNDCSQKKIGGQYCTKCNFHVCRTCIEVFHTDFCQEERYSPYTTLEFCQDCGQNRKGGKCCSKCNYKVCRVCENLQHETFCLFSNYHYYNSNQFCLTCGQTRTGGKICTQCNYKICRQCEL